MPDFPATLPDHAVAGRYNEPWAGPGAFWTQLILEDLDMLGEAARPTVLDIGCGNGVQGEPGWQALIAEACGEYLGVDPGAPAEPEPGSVFTRRWAAAFEAAPLQDVSVDLAYAAMVLEHVQEPELFFAQLARVIRPGGVFWGFTVDRRHYFSWFSQLLGGLGLKDRYLDRVRGRRGEADARYENFPTCYRCNTPTALRRLAGPAFKLQTWSLHRVGQLDGYLPWRLRRLSRLADRGVLRWGLPGSVLVVRAVRRPAVAGMDAGPGQSSAEGGSRRGSG